MRNDDFVVRLTSYNKLKSHVMSSVNIQCDEYETFKKIVEAIIPILEEEEKNYECEKNRK